MKHRTGFSLVGLNLYKIIRVVSALVLVVVIGLGNTGFVHAEKQNPVLLVQSQEQTVAFNTKTHKFHGLDCTWAHRCTRNCITISRKEAIRRGGIPCKVCGGM